MNHQMPSAAKLHIDIHGVFDLVCWARHFGVTQRRVVEAVSAVGSRVDKVAAYLRAA